MDALVVGQKRFWTDYHSQEEFKITAISNYCCLYSYNNSTDESSVTIAYVLEHSKPYQEPKPVIKIVGHMNKNNGDIFLSIDKDKTCTIRDSSDNCERIELTPSMFGWDEQLLKGKE